MSARRKPPIEDGHGRILKPLPAAVDLPPGTVHALRIGFHTHYDGEGTVRTDYVRAEVSALPAEIADAIFAEGEPGHTLWKDLIGEVNDRLGALTTTDGSALLRLRSIRRTDDATAVEFNMDERLQIADLHRLHYGAAIVAGTLEQVAEEWAADVRKTARALRLQWRPAKPEVTP